LQQGLGQGQGVDARRPREAQGQAGGVVAVLRALGPLYGHVGQGDSGQLSPVARLPGRRRYQVGYVVLDYDGARNGRSFPLRRSSQKLSRVRARTSRNERWPEGASSTRATPSVRICSKS
jgi:hypothetical protein